MDKISSSKVYDIIKANASKPHTFPLPAMTPISSRSARIT